MRSSSSRPVASNRHSSTLLALAENRAKFTPRPSQVAPSGNGSPSRTRECRMTLGGSSTATCGSLCCGFCRLFIVSSSWRAAEILCSAVRCCRYLRVLERLLPPVFLLLLLLLLLLVVDVDSVGFAVLLERALRLVPALAVLPGTWEVSVASGWVSPSSSRRGWRVRLTVADSGGSCPMGPDPGSGSPFAGRGLPRSCTGMSWATSRASR